MIKNFLSKFIILSLLFVDIFSFSGVFAQVQLPDSQEICPGGCPVVTDESDSTMSESFASKESTLAKRVLNIVQFITYIIIIITVLSLIPAIVLGILCLTTFKDKTGKKRTKLGIKLIVAPFAVLILTFIINFLILLVGVFILQIQLFNNLDDLI